MKNKILLISVFVVTALVVGFYPLLNEHRASEDKTPPLIADHSDKETPLIQLAILLDTSSSMDGLIDQARNQLWQVVNEFSRSRKNGLTPRLEVAVYEYGNDGLAAESGYIRRVSNLTTELDQVSEALFSLKTNGGNEYCGYAIQTAVDELAWSMDKNDIKTIFIAGNEPFTQGPIVYSKAIAAARDKGIAVNTIHAGDYESGASSGWRDGALLAGGDYMNIDHNHQVVHLNAPQDNQIAMLNAKLNDTYIPYGSQGKEKQLRQKAEDEKSMEVSEGLMAKRAMSKVTTMYNNSSWDLVDALENETVKLDSLSPEALPAELKDLSDADLNQYVLGKAEERRKIKEEIQTLSQARQSWVKEQRSAEPEASTIDTAIIKAVRKQGEKKNYDFGK